MYVPFDERCRPLPANLFLSGRHWLVSLHPLLLPPSLGVVLPVNWLISVPQVTQAIREGAVKRSKEELDNLQVNADWNRMMVRAPSFDERPFARLPRPVLILQYVRA